MSSVSGKDADFDISASSHKHSSHAGSEESLEPDGDETGYINQTANEESDTKNELESATEDFGESTLGSLPSKSSDDEDKDENVTTTAPVVLIPAIKGSREKHGLTLKKTSVSWAADVYDPPPSIASHTRNKKQQQQKSKSKDSHRKNGKKGQKGKDNSNSSRSGKDKKQASRKHSREKFDWVTQMPIVAASS
ncbi:hypothetical protein Bca4012_035503 [Brassica carinata]|uniref:Uncharacterized protein n=1 Tax=Brassica carinata TaxID=52824 RepID=A0A8X7WCD3_BRACI|nr:hypothetical protein Bca52824_009283 [Brassica carinata]